MRQPFVYNDAEFLRAMQGRGNVFYSGARRQRGGSILGTVFKFMQNYGMPVASKLLAPIAKSLYGTHKAMKNENKDFGTALSESVGRSFGGRGLTDLKRARLSGRGKRRRGTFGRKRRRR